MKLSALLLYTVIVKYTLWYEAYSFNRNDLGGIVIAVESPDNLIRINGRNGWYGPLNVSLIFQYSSFL